MPGGQATGAELRSCRGMAPALSVTGLHKAYGPVQALRGVDLEVGARRARRAARAQRRRQVDAREDHLRPGPPERGRGRRCAARPPARPTAHRALGYLAELFRFPDWCTAEELLELHQELVGSPRRRGRAGASCSSSSSSTTCPTRRDRRDVEGHAAAARDRPGADRGAAAAAARRADERARPRRAAHGARAARAAARARRRRAAQLAPALRGRAGLRPRGDHRRRRGGRRGHAGGAQPRRRGRGRDGARRARSSPTRRARTRRGSCASSSPRARTSSPCACDLDARGRLPRRGRPHAGGRGRRRRERGCTAPRRRSGRPRC